MIAKRFQWVYIKNNSLELRDNGIVKVFNNERLEELLNELSNENEQLKKLLECSRKEANDYCEELMGKDEFIRLYKRQRDEFMEENEQLKKQNQRLKEQNNKLRKVTKYYDGIVGGFKIGDL